MIKQKDFAVIKINGNQHAVSEGQEILVDRISAKDLNPDVLLMVKEEKISIGKPILKNINLKLKIIGEEKGRKIDILKYKAKSRYRRRLGFRPIYSRLKIERLG